MILTAAHIAPVDQPVIEDGRIEVRDGRVVSVGPTSRSGGASAIDFGEALIVPGFVNAHTHLELTWLAGRVAPTSDFVDWLERLVDHLRSTQVSAESVARTVADGVRQSLAHGVTTVGDITRNPQWTRPALAASPLRVRSYGEVIAIGTTRHLLSDRLDAAGSTTHRAKRLHIGLSPHAPYTVEPDGLRACAQRAGVLGVPLCMHLAETCAEEAFTQTATGPLADYLRGLGVLDDAVPASGCRPVELAHRTGLLRGDTLVAHANYVQDHEIALLAQAKTSVAYCPRTHRAFEHPPHRFLDMLTAGVNVCIGTDSLASNPSLSVLDELRFLRRAFPDVAPDLLLEMGTSHGAQALGLDCHVGSITPGKSADLVVLPLDNAHGGDPVGAILDSSAPPIAVFVAGDQINRT